MKKIWLTGSAGMVGSSISRSFGLSGLSDKYNLISTDSKTVNLLDQNKTRMFVENTKPDIAILAAARVGGVHSNSNYPSTFSVENTLIQINALDSLIKNNVEKIIFIGSSCIYPSNAPLPLHPDSLNTGKLEPTNKWYAMAKLSMIYSLNAAAKQHGVQVATLLPTNLYGPNDNFHILDGHVIPSLMMKAHSAKLNNFDKFEVWGSGKPMREVLFVDDFASAVLQVLQKDNVEEIINVGSGEEYSIREIAEIIADVVGFTGDLAFNSNKPDGAFRKPLNSDYIHNIGWKSDTKFKDGLKITYQWLLDNEKNLRNKGVSL